MSFFFYTKTTNRKENKSLFFSSYSCGYRKAFEQYSQAIHARYPEIKIVGENYTPETYKLYLAQGLSFLKILILACVLLGQNPFAYLNMPTPNAFLWAQENKVRTLIPLLSQFR